MPTFTSQRTTYPYVYLHDASYYALQDGIAVVEGNFFKFMTSMLFASFSVEGYLNFLGENKVPQWGKKERRLGRDGRLNELLSALNVNPSMTTRPFKTYSDLFAFRDELVHSRVTTTVLAGELSSIDERPPRPLPGWEQLISQEVAERFYVDSSQIIRTLHRSAGYDRDPFSSPWTDQWEKKQ